IVLERAAVVVAELKGYRGLTSAAFDQVLAYARDLRAYHRECADRPVVPVLISSAAARPPWRREGVTVCHPEDVDTVLTEIAREPPAPPRARRTSSRPAPICRCRRSCRRRASSSRHASCRTSSARGRRRSR